LAKTCDIETWLPGQGKYRETQSISSARDYQARRLNIKFKSEEGNKFVYIFNGTVFAIGRTIIAILENYQNEDGSVTVPEVLRKWIGKDKLTPQ
jgi:seryl-tRNA synthetase